jgi:hypothetical protein
VAGLRLDLALDWLRLRDGAGRECKADSGNCDSVFSHRGAPHV